MELSHQAIVLQLPTPQRGEYLFFDQKLGTIPVRAHKKNTVRTLTRGTLIQYVPQERGGYYYSQAIEVIAIPQLWAVSNIFFLHHIIEIIDFFIPRRHQAENIFMLTLMIYKKLDDNVDVAFFQKLFLCRFFAMVGIYPEPVHLEDRKFLSMILSGSDDNLDEQKYVFLEKKMIQWLRECIRLHPYADRLKTTIMEPWCNYEKNTSSF